eukprot:CAMPEP_0178381430 /NCGR_PEP_ID=MMETSP0689_2-20121128/5978_1 /TAXON_ID=160604 /ORGANISM="Amphidinium massartii, Strain CS-259" /LENGTH=345 /DNA_ID=CAMNT_0020001611 /DNA_START=110 /DNA_END=1141 /DNA_ORIENTATION=-
MAALDSSSVADLRSIATELIQENQRLRTRLEHSEVELQDTRLFVSETRTADNQRHSDSELAAQHEETLEDEVAKLFASFDDQDKIMALQLDEIEELQRRLADADRKLHTTKVKLESRAASPSLGGSPPLQQTVVSAQPVAHRTPRRWVQTSLGEDEATQSQSEAGLDGVRAVAAGGAVAAAAAASSCKAEAEGARRRCRRHRDRQAVPHQHQVMPGAVVPSAARVGTIVLQLPADAATLDIKKRLKDEGLGWKQLMSRSWAVDDERGHGGLEAASAAPSWNASEARHASAGAGSAGWRSSAAGQVQRRPDDSSQQEWARTLGTARIPHHAWRSTLAGEGAAESGA